MGGGAGGGRGKGEWGKVIFPLSNRRPSSAAPVFHKNILFTREVGAGVGVGVAGRGRMETNEMEHGEVGYLV